MAVRTALRSSTDWPKVGRFFGAVGDTVFGQGVIGQPQEAGDFAVAHLLPQQVALGFGRSGVHLDDIGGRGQ